MISKASVRATVKEYLILTLACFFFAWSWEGFMIPNNLSAGGMMGLCTVIQYATGGVLPAQYSYIAINALLILVAVFAMGIGFGFKTIWCIAISTLEMQLVASLTFLHSVPGEFFYVKDTLLIPVFAGVLEALGLGLVIRYGGSTGGTDIIALMINKYYPVSLSKAFLVLDLCVVALVLLLPDKTFTDMSYGMVEIVIFTLLIDTVVGGQKNSFQLLVFSDKFEEIADHIIKDMDRGVTIVKAKGWYTKKDKDVLLILVSRKELNELVKHIHAIDPRAFMSVSSINNVYGEGFEEVKSGLTSIKKKDKDVDGKK